ncbi:hypothetical protein ONZ43_g115 [Nemania bipapillata]|uniref:Uncharacterized protein n=1 Tax=Nemania bipapillata TaxID=110536 RepID=A0ACC2J9L7_9PEZI|nr:hypothetical protein ONZ43_g115 [Nemania bipapillata]
MGLAGPRNRRKLDHDPNNTRWTRDETTFGQKILRAQGWEPGKYLGAQDTAHAQLHSAASLAPIKINLKDDTLGLGAKIRQKVSDECTGLDAFKDLLGRLNGKSEETLNMERQVRSEIKTNLFVERKYGPMRFVSGGLLVGDQIKMAELAENNSVSTHIKEESMSDASEVESIKKEKKEKKEKKSKKRKASESEEADTSDNRSEKKRKKRSKVDEEVGNDDTEIEETIKKDKKEKRSKRSKKASEDEKNAVPGEPEVKRKKSKKSKDIAVQDSLSNISNSSVETPGDATSEKARKKEKKKEKKRKQAEGVESDIAMAAAAAAKTTTTVSSTTSLVATSQDSGSSTPNSTRTSTPQLSARHLSRSRHIAAKKMAFSDMQALNQIFMIKPV